MKQNRRRRAAVRIDQVKNKLKNEETREHLHLFLEHYFLCEVASKEMLVGYLEQKNELLQFEDAKMDLRKLKAAYNTYGLGLEEALYTRLFAGKKAKGRPRSAKMLRDSLVHSITKNNLTELDERFEDLMNDIQIFLKTISEE